MLVKLYGRHAYWEGPVTLLSNGLFLGGSCLPGGSWKWDPAERILVLRWSHWPADHLHLCDWGLEASNLRLEFGPDEGPDEWHSAMATHLSHP